MSNEIVAPSTRAELEAGFASSFIVTGRRERFVQIAGARDLPARSGGSGRKRRSNYHSLIANLEYWIAPSSIAAPFRSAEFESFCAGLRGSEGPDDCYAMSLDPEIDGRRFVRERLGEMLVDGDNQTSLFIFSIERLALYWHGEIADVSCLLRG